MKEFLDFIEFAICERPFETFLWIVLPAIFISWFLKNAFKED